MAVALKEIFARFGVDFDASALKKGSVEVQDMVKRLADLGKQLTGPAIVTGAALFVRGMIEQGKELADQAAALNTSATSMREWQYVAERNGVPAEQMNQALSTLANNARASVSGNYDLAYAFRRLQVNVRDANGQLKPTGDLMAEVGTQIAKIGNPLIRARMTMQHFGEAGRFLIPIFEKGATSINAMRQEVRDLVGGDLDELAKQSRQVRGEQARFKLAFDALTTTITLHLLPVFRWLTVGISKIIAEGKKLVENTRLIEAAMITLGAVFVIQGLKMAAAMLPVIIPMLPIALGLAFIILLVDDLLVLMAGGKSSIGDFIDSFYGAGTAAELVGGIKLVTADLVNWLADTGIPGVVDFFSSMYDAGASAIDDMNELIKSLLINLSKIPGLGFIAGHVGALRTETAMTRGVPGQTSGTIYGRPRGATDVRAPVEAIVRTMTRGVPGQTSGTIYGRPRGATDVRVQAPVTVNVQTTPEQDPEAIAGAVGRIQDERTRNAIQLARQALGNRVPQEA